MKRSVMAITFLLLIAFGTFFGIFSLKKSGAGIIDIVEECEASLKEKDYPKALRIVEKIDREWQDNKLLTAILSGNGKTHSIDIALKSVKMRMENANWDEALFQLGLLVEEIKAIFTSEEANAENMV